MPCLMVGKVDIARLAVDLFRAVTLEPRLILGTRPPARIVAGGHVLGWPVLQSIDVAQPGFLTEPEIQRRERDNLWMVLQKTGWKIKGADGAAELLGVKPTTLISRIKKMGLKPRDPVPSGLPGS